MNKNIYTILDQAYAINKGCVKIHKNAILKHELAKFFVAWEQINNENTVITEARFLNGKGRADIYVPEIDTAFEIINSEKEESIERKENEYPCSVIFLKADDVIKHWIKTINPPLLRQE